MSAAIFPISSFIICPARPCAAFTAAMITSSSISVSATSIFSLSIFSFTSSIFPFTVACTIPPPASAVTVFFASSPCIRSICWRISCALFMMSPRFIPLSASNMVILLRWVTPRAQHDSAPRPRLLDFHRRRVEVLHHRRHQRVRLHLLHQLRRDPNRRRPRRHSRLDRRRPRRRSPLRHRPRLTPIRRCLDLRSNLFDLKPHSHRPPQRLRQALPQQILLSVLLQHLGERREAAREADHRLVILHPHELRIRKHPVQPLLPLHRLQELPPRRREIPARDDRLHVAERLRGRIPNFHAGLGSGSFRPGFLPTRRSIPPREQLRKRRPRIIPNLPRPRQVIILIQIQRRRRRNHRRRPHVHRRRLHHLRPRRHKRLHYRLRRFHLPHHRPIWAFFLRRRPIPNRTTRGRTPHPSQELRNRRKLLRQRHPHQRRIQQRPPRLRL